MLVDLAYMNYTYIQGDEWGVHVRVYGTADHEIVNLLVEGLWVRAEERRLAKLCN